MHGKFVILYGTIMDSSAPGTIVLDVNGQMGDAPRFGLAGQISLARRQCCEIVERRVSNGHDLVRLPAHVAESKSQASRRT